MPGLGAASLDLFAGTTWRAGSRVTGGFRVGVAPGKPTKVGAVRVGIPRTVSARYPVFTVEIAVVRPTSSEKDFPTARAFLT